MGVPSIGIEMKDGNYLDIPDLAMRYGKRYQIHGHEFPRNMIDLLNWEYGIQVIFQVLKSFEDTSDGLRPMTINKESIKLEAPIQKPSKIVAVALNYRDHIEEQNLSVPEAPIIFAKFPSSIVGPDVQIPLSKATKELDWEVELGVVIGKKCRSITKDEVLDYIAGYTILNDLSARDLLFKDGQWTRGKSLDGLCPMGPCIVTVDELGDGSGLNMYTKVNGVIKQDSNTSNMVFDVKFLVSYLSQYFTLLPGDVIATGTPSGVGFARNPPEFLKPGDEVELYIEKIGYLRNTMISSS
jgi:acylpyruvate hydrolase